MIVLDLGRSVPAASFADPSVRAADDDPARDAMLRIGRFLLYPGLALTSLLVLRGPAELPVGDILVALGGLFAALSTRKPARWTPAALWIAAPMLIVGAALAATVSSDPANSLNIAARLGYMVVVLPWIMLTLLVDRRHVGRAFGWWLAGGALCALGAIAQFVLGDVIPGGAVTSDSRFTGFTTHPSDLGGVMAVATIAAFAIVLSGASARARYAAAVVMLVSGVGLVLSGSVSAMLGLLGGLVFLLARRAIQLRRGALIVAAAVGLIGVVTAQLSLIGALNPVERLLRTTGYLSAKSEYDTAGIRLELAERAIDVIMEHPLVGQGMVTADNVLLGTFTVHNNLLAAWVSGGVLTFLGVLIPTMFALRCCLRRNPSPLAAAVSGSVVAAVIFAQSAPGIYNRYYWLPIAFVLVLELMTRDERKRAAREAERGGEPDPDETPPASWPGRVAQPA